MTTAQQLAVIELLRVRAFPAERGPTELGRSGPGYHLAELFRGDGTADAGQHGAEHTALTGILTARFGEPHHISLWSVRTRVGAGEEIPAPWRELSDGFEYLHLWRWEGRWLALGAAGEAGPDGEAGRDGEAGERPFRIVVAVTETDPP
ncbi:hypothetical protein ACFXBB_00245 [Streptomyces scopuliridis]|uniref:hypothetical protein n=1 Tax=Streptomyces scopuliridis TaxID=452529 RepID=UPI0036A267D3